MIKWALLMFEVVLLFGCATPTILLLHPETGRVLECKPSGRYAPTLIGQIVTNKEIESCVKQFEALGFIRADKMTPEQRARVGAIVRPPTSAASKPAGLNGTFTGDIQGMAYGKAFAMRVTFTLVQNGDQVVGVWNTTGGTSGTVSGLIPIRAFQCSAPSRLIRVRVNSQARRRSRIMGSAYVVLTQAATAMDPSAQPLPSIAALSSQRRRTRGLSGRVISRAAAIDAHPTGGTCGHSHV